MSFSYLLWAIKCRYRIIRIKVLMAYYQRIQGLSRIEALGKLIRHSIGKN